MRKILPIILIITALFSSCSAENKTINAKEYVFGQDNQYMYSDSVTGYCLQKTEDGYVYYKSGFLYFVDTKSRKAQPLCNKPNCLHENEKDNPSDCRAYIGMTEGGDNIQYYDGGIYYPVSVTDEKTSETRFFIRRYDVKSLSVKDIVELKGNPSESFIVHRGNAYIEMYKGAEAGGELIETELKKINLCGDKTPEKICDFNKLGLSLLAVKNMQAYGNYVCFNAECVKLGTDLSDSDNDSFSEKRYAYNTENGELICITDNARGKEPYFCGFYNGKLLYLSGDNCVYQADLDGKNTEVFFKYDKKYYGYSVITDGKYFYLNDEEKSAGIYTVFTSDGKQINTVKMPFSIGTTAYDKSFIIRLMNDRELRLIDKQKIESFKEMKSELLYTFKNIVVR